MDVLQNHEVANLFYALSKDIERWDFGLGVAVRENITTHVIPRLETRGIKDLLVHLPKMGKLLDTCISRCEYSPRRARGIKTCPRTGYPLLFRDLWEVIFPSITTESLPWGLEDRTMLLTHEDVSNEIFFLRTFLNCLKKVVVDCPPENIRKEMMEFISIDQGLRVPTLSWNSTQWFDSEVASITALKYQDALNYDGYYPDYPTLRRSLKYLDWVSAVLQSQMPELVTEDLIPKHGPGAVADMRGGTDKYLLPTWSEDLDKRFPADLFAYSSEEWAHVDTESPKDNRKALARLTAVPKTYEKPRLITVEATSQQWLQQAMLKWFRDHYPKALRQTTDFFSQDKSREGARSASISGRSATVDLSSASDRLSLWTVERAFCYRPDLLQALQAIRSQLVEITLPCSSDSEILEIKKYAGQGCAVTFILQSYIYSMCCIAAIMASRRYKLSVASLKRAAKYVRVFGDDLIVPTDSLPTLALIFNVLQLKINSEKTHFDGPFRESCGGDYFRGRDVTPLYLRHIASVNQPADITSVVDVCNNAYTKGLWETSQSIQQLLPMWVQKRLVVSNVPQAVLTLRTFTTCETPHGGKYRWNRDIHRVEVRGIKVVPGVSRTERESAQELLAFFTERFNYESQNPAEVRPRIEENPWTTGYFVPGKVNLRARWVLAL